MARADKPVETPSGADLARQALDSPGDHDAIEKQIAELSPEEARLFAEMIGMALRKRRLLLIGYVVALTAVLAGMVIGLWIYGAYGQGRFVGWVFMLPPLLGGLVLWLVGRRVRRMK